VQLARDRQMRDAMRINARERANSFSLKKMVEQTEKMYESLADKKRIRL